MDAKIKTVREVFMDQLDRANAMWAKSYPYGMFVVSIGKKNGPYKNVIIAEIISKRPTDRRRYSVGISNQNGAIMSHWPNQDHFRMTHFNHFKEFITRLRRVNFDKVYIDKLVEIQKQRMKT